MEEAWELDERARCGYLREIWVKLGGMQTKTGDQ